MQARNAAFGLLRRLALQELKPILSKPKQWSKHNAFLRPLSYRATTALRSATETPSQVPLTDRIKGAESSHLSPEKPSYELTFTCKPCGARSSHRVSKQGYHHGSVLISCPGCKNRHVISDHLNIFGDRAMTIEDLMKDKGQLVKKGTLSEDGDLEFWDDGSTTKRVKEQEKVQDDQTSA